MSSFSAKISIWIKIFSSGLSLPSILIYVIMGRFCGAWIRSELLMRKICHGLSLYMILSKVISYQLMEEVQATKILSSKSRSYTPKIFACSFVKILPLSKYYQRPWPKFSWRKKNSHGCQSQNSIFREFLIPCGPCYYSWLCVIPEFASKTKYLSYVCPGSIVHTYG
jgi:hypothetical protein